MNEVGVNIVCPSCGSRIPAQQIELSVGWVKCAACDQLFRFDKRQSGLTPINSPIRVRERPAEARALLERGPTDLRVRFPARGIHGHLWLGVVAAVVALGFAAIFAIMTWEITSPSPNAVINDVRSKIFLDAFFTLIGLIPLGLVTWDARKTRTIDVNDREIVNEFRSLFFRRRQRFPRDDVQLARRQEEQAAKKDIRGVEVVYQGGSFVLQVESEAEADWLVEVINERLNRQEHLNHEPVNEPLFASETSDESRTKQALKIDCPTCKARIRSENISLKSGWAKCAGCDELFALEDLLPGYGTARATRQLPQRPFNARSTIEETPTELILRVPRAPRRRTSASQIRGCALGLLGFAALLSCCMLSAAMSEPSSYDALPWTYPFWLAGALFLGFAVWDARRVRSIRINATEAVFDSRLFFLHRVRRFPRSDVQYARRQERQTLKSHLDESNPVIGVEIVYRNGLFFLPVESEAEADWMIQTLNEFLDRHRSATTNRDETGE